MSSADLPASGTFVAANGYVLDWGDVPSPDPIVFGPPRYQSPPVYRDLVLQPDGTYREVPPFQVPAFENDHLPPDRTPAQLVEDEMRQRLLAEIQDHTDESRRRTRELEEHVLISGWASLDEAREAARVMQQYLLRG